MSLEIVRSYRLSTGNLLTKVRIVSPPHGLCISLHHRRTISYKFTENAPLKATNFLSENKQVDQHFLEDLSKVEQSFSQKL